MKVNKLVVGQLQTNCYIVSSNSDCFIIDPGDDADYIMSRIRDLELAPFGIIATHGHFDHILAVIELKLAYRIPFYIHEGDEFLLKRMSKTAKYFIGFDPGPAPQADRFLKDRQRLEIGKDILNIIHTPGHTPGSISLVGRGVVFVGDLIFSGGSVGRTDLEGGDKELLDKSIKKILKLPTETIVYSGHGEETTINEVSSYFKSLTQRSS